MITPSHLCQNPSHAHHHSHHMKLNSVGYRFAVADTVVEESTGGSVVTVISNSTTTPPPPDIILTNSESESGPHDFDENVTETIRSVPINSIHNPTDEIVHDQSAIMSVPLTCAPTTSTVSPTSSPPPSPSTPLLSLSSSPPLPQPSISTAQATEIIPNNSEAGTDSIHINSFNYEQLQTHNYGRFGNIFQTSCIEYWKVLTAKSYRGIIFA